MNKASVTHQLIEQILVDLGVALRGWQVRDIRVEPSSVPSLHPGLATGDQFLVEIEIPEADGFSLTIVGVHLLELPPRADHLAIVASDIQDHVIDHYWGEPLPECPGHPHPLFPECVAGKELWVCPINRSHYSKPIAGGGRDYTVDLHE